MNEQLPQKPTELDIDVEQWRRDIQTFAETTNRALAAIAEELSNECSSSHVKQPTTGDAVKEVEPRPSTQSAFATREKQGNDRLANLKSQLSQRISKTS